MSGEAVSVQILAEDGSKLHGQFLAAFEREQCRLTLTVADRCYARTASDAFEAMRLIRLQLEAEGYRLVCNGACKNVWPSGMSRSMGGGCTAYRLTIGQKPTEDDSVSIFDSHPNLTPATVEEQTAFHDQWLKSIGCDGKHRQLVPIESIVEDWFKRLLLVLLAFLAAYHLWNLR